MSNFFPDIQTLKKFIGGAANLSIEIEDLAPTIHSAAVKYLKPWLGSYYNTVHDGYPYVTPDAKKGLLSPYIQRTLAHFTMYEYSKVGGVQFSGAGLTRTETESQKTAYKYQENEYRAYMLDHAYEALDELLIYLEDNKIDHTAWPDINRAKSRAHFVNYAEEFRAVYSANISRQTYDVLRPLLTDIDLFAIRPILGDTLYDYIKAKILANTSYTDEEKELIALLQKVETYFTVKEGFARHWIKLEGDSLVYDESGSTESADKVKRPANADQVGWHSRHMDEFGNRYVNTVIKYLNDNADAFNGWPLEVVADADAIDSEDEACCDRTCGSGCSKESNSIINF